MEEGASLISISLLVLTLVAFGSSEAREKHGHQSNGHHRFKYSPVSPELASKLALAPTPEGPIPAPAPAPAPAGPVDPITYTSYFFPIPAPAPSPELASKLALAPAPAGPIDPITYTSYFFPVPAPAPAPAGPIDPITYTSYFFPVPAPAPSPTTAPTEPLSAPAGRTPNDGIPLVPSYALPQLSPSMSLLESQYPSPIGSDIEPLPYPYVAAPPPDSPGLMPPQGSWKCGEGPCWDSEYCDFPCTVCKGGVCCPEDYSYEYLWMFAPSYPMAP